MRQSIFKTHHMPLPPLAHNVSDPSKLSPLDWSNYFENKQQLAIGDTTFNVYSSGLTNTGAIFVFHHGAGHSGLTFGLAAKYIFDHCPELCTVVAPDCRNHGDTTGENQENLNLDQMVDDLVNVFERMFPDNTRDIVLVGHSMGGAVVAHVAKSKRLPHILGLALVDIVEGSAMDSLPSIPMFISQRPQSFKTVESAIAWHIDSEAIHNPESARLSVPSLIRRFDRADKPSLYCWRTNLLPTEKFWRGWYEGLSKTFSTAPTAKLLILAGTDRLDKELLIAQMQGKFQLEVMPAAGHTIQEDLPSQFGDIVLAFWKRNQWLNIPVKRFPLK